MMKNPKKFSNPSKLSLHKNLDKLNSPIKEYKINNIRTIFSSPNFSKKCNGWEIRDKSKSYLKNAEFEIDNLRKRLKTENKQIINDISTSAMRKYDKINNSIKKIEYKDIIKDINFRNPKSSNSGIRSNSLNKLKSLNNDILKMLKSVPVPVEKVIMPEETKRKANIERIINIKNRIDNVFDKIKQSKSPSIIKSINTIFSDNVFNSNLNSVRMPIHSNSRNSPSLLKKISNDISPFKNSSFLGVGINTYKYEKNPFEPIKGMKITHSNLFKYFK